MKRWEYKVLVIDQSSDNEGEIAMNRIGPEGWELVSVVMNGGRLTMYFKRERI